MLEQKKQTIVDVMNFERAKKIGIAEETEIIKTEIKQLLRGSNSKILQFIEDLDKNKTIGK